MNETWQLKNIIAIKFSTACIMEKLFERHGIPHEQKVNHEWMMKQIENVIHRDKPVQKNK